MDTAAYEEYVKRILKSRDDSKTDKRTILHSGLFQYAKYGEESPLRDIYSSKELENIDIHSLVETVKEMKNSPHSVFYYGKKTKETKRIVEKYHSLPKEFVPLPERKGYAELSTKKSVYFVDYDMVQSELILLSKDTLFTPHFMALSRVFNSYFGSGLSSIVFQEIREARSLAYSAYSWYRESAEKGEPNYVQAYIGTQTNKLPLAVDAMKGLLNDMPEVEAQFLDSKTSALKRIASQRVTKANIFWSYRRLLKKGIDFDVRKDIYKEIEAMTLSDLKLFFNQRIKNKNFTALVIGNKKDMNLKALSRLGKVKEMDIDFLFNYK